MSPRGSPARGSEDVTGGAFGPRKDRLATAGFSRPALVNVDETPGVRILRVQVQSGSVPTAPEGSTRTQGRPRRLLQDLPGAPGKRVFRCVSTRPLAPGAYSRGQAPMATGDQGAALIPNRAGWGHCSRSPGPPPPALALTHPPRCRCRGQELRGPPGRGRCVELEWGPRAAPLLVPWAGWGRWGWWPSRHRALGGGQPLPWADGLRLLASLVLSKILPPGWAKSPVSQCER